MRKYQKSLYPYSTQSVRGVDRKNVYDVPKSIESRPLPSIPVDPPPVPKIKQIEVGILWLNLLLFFCLFIHWHLSGNLFFVRVEFLSNKYPLECKLTRIFTSSFLFQGSNGVEISQIPKRNRIHKCFHGLRTNNFEQHFRLPVSTACCSFFFRQVPFFPLHRARLCRPAAATSVHQ